MSVEGEGLVPEETAGAKKADALRGPELSMDERTKLSIVWLEQGAVVAAKAEDVEALKITDFLEDKALPIEPIAGGYRAQANAPEDTVHVLLLVEGDAQIDERYRRVLFEDQNVASYLPSHRILQVNESIPTSPTWKGILVLHEGMHALVHTEENYDWQDPQVFCEKERDVFIFQSRIMSKIGGEPYAAAFGKKARELLHGVKEDQAGFLTFPGKGEYSEELDEAFGAALSKREKDARQTALWIDAVFAMFDAQFGEEQGAKEKTTFMKYLYKR